MAKKKVKTEVVYENKSPKEFYQEELSKRQPFEDRAEQIAELTIPALFRKKGSGGSEKLKDMYCQGLLAKLIKSLSSKITLTLFPPGASGFRLEPDAVSLQELTGGDPEILSQVRSDLSAGSDLINKEIEAQDIRKHIFGLIDHQIVVGACIMEKVPKRGIKIHSLRNMVVLLDDVGEAIQMCVYEELNRVPEGIEFEEDRAVGEKYELYTMCTWLPEMKKWEVVQEFEGIMLEPKYYTDKKVPFSYQGMVWNVGEDYHRPLCEDIIGSISSYDKLSKVLTEGSLIASKSLLFVDERGGRTRKRDVANSANGDVIDGRADDVTAFTFGKNFDFQVPMQVRNELQQELEEFFLAKNSITRQAERVTAEEIREMAQELEMQMAGVYAVISNRITKRIVEWIMAELNMEFKAIDVKIVTGLNALGMNNEVMKLDGFVSRLAQLEKIEWLEEKELIDRYAEGYGVNTVGLLKTPQQLAQERQMQQQQALEMQALQSGADSLGATAGQKLAGGQ